MIDIGQIRQWCNGKWVAENNTRTSIDRLLTDSRDVMGTENGLFIAIKTNLRNGHTFLQDAWNAGVRNFLVEQLPDTANLEGANIIQVKDTLVALQQIAAANRKQFSIPVIGITGSNGKTIVKEWLYQLLGGVYNTVRSPKSYNSQLGVPLSVWQMEREHQLAIFEAGISQPGEMEKLEKVIQPTIGVFTNIGEAHSEGFLNNRQKINEKLVLFRHARHLVYCRDKAALNECIVPFLHHINSGVADTGLKLFCWSARQEADLQITAIVKDVASTHIRAIYKAEEKSITIPFADDASVENAIHCWCVALLLGLADADITAGMARLQPVSMRLELKHGANDCTLINDAYNSDLTSLQSALAYLDQQRQHVRHTVILSDMLQMGKSDHDLYSEVAEMISKKRVQSFIGIGPALCKNKAAFRKYRKFRSVFFRSTADFLKKMHLLTFQKEAILLKGARVFEFEKIGMLLEQQVHQTELTINLQALRNNYNVFRGRLLPGVKIMAMVKAFAYGSGSAEIAGLLQHAGVDYLTVAYTDEGIALRRSGITLPIMVMSPELSSFDRMIAWKLEPELYNFRSLEAFLKMANTLQVQAYPVHIKLDTGMHRLGFTRQDIPALATMLQGEQRVQVTSVFSHLAASDDSREDDFTSQQAESFRQMCGQLTNALGYQPLRHLCNSAGIARHPELHFDMVRLGLGLYGMETGGMLDGRLQQIGTLKTTIAQIKQLEQGENVGYGHHTLAPGNMRIATISIGYADGYPRSLGNGRAWVLIHGRRAPTVGSICMDMCMVDITAIPEAREGDDVVVFGRELSVHLLAEWSNTITYEIMAGISQRVKRVYVNED